MNGTRILLIIGGGIAAYKSLDLIRRARERGAQVRAVLTASAEHFVTPLSVSTLCEEKAFTDLFDLKDETEIGHIQLSRDADIIIVAPRHRQSARQDGAWPGRRSRNVRTAGRE